MVIASSNGKEVILGPLLCDFLKVSPVIDAEFKSDLIREGTAKSKETPLRLVRNKLLHALTISSESLGIGTEALFMSHPKYPWIVVHTETAMLLDLKTNVEALYSIISLQTNYQAATVSTIQELMDFAEQIGFPSHGVRFSVAPLRRRYDARFLAALQIQIQPVQPEPVRPRPRPVHVAEHRLRPPRRMLGLSGRCSRRGQCSASNRSP